MSNIPSNVRPDYRPIGSDGTYLVADASQAEGTKWGYLCQGAVHDLTPDYFIPSPSAVLVGAGFYHPSFSFSYNEVASGNGIQSVTYGDIETTLTSFSHTWQGTGIFYQNTVGAFERFFLFGYSNYGCADSVSGAYIYWYQNIHYGVYATGSTLDGSFISSKLTNTFLTGNKAITFNVTAGSGEYVWYAYRVLAGTPSFSVNDYNGGFQLAATGVAFTNASGFTEQYQIWRSDYPSLGSVTVVVT